MDPFLAGSAINAGAGIVQNAFGIAFNNQANRQNMENWREANRYNSPKEQLKRMEEAGLNKNLMYGRGGGGGSAAVPPQIQKNSVDLSRVAEAVSLFLDLKKKDADIENTRTDTEVKNITGSGQMLENEKKAFEVSQGQDGLSPFAKKYLAQIQNLEANTTGTDAKTYQTLQATENLKVNEQILRQQFKEMGWKEFIPKAQKDRYDKYQILPDDAETVQFLKIVAKDIFNMPWEQARNTILKTIKIF